MSLSHSSRDVSTYMSHGPLMVLQKPNHSLERIKERCS